MIKPKSAAKSRPASKVKPTPKSRPPLPKTPTGIQGVDEITGGGLPKGRPTLVCGSTGSGKTLLAMDFLVQGATQFNEPGVFMAFEETAEDLIKNSASLGFDLKDLIARKKIVLDSVYIERVEIEESGEYDLEGLFIRLGLAIDSIGAKRVVLDTVESLFAGLPNQVILRAELRRLFRWLKEKGVTAIITAERGNETLTRQGLEEYVSDCVILLDLRVNEQASSRRLRVVKYRGSTHGTNEYPFLINEDGISMLPITSLRLNHVAPSERVSSGIPGLDEMMDGAGYYRGSSVLITGTSGAGKSCFAGHFAAAACRRGERVIYFAFEESPSQIIRNMHSIGIDLQQWEKKGLLQIQANRPTFMSLEMHLTTMQKAVNTFKPQVVILDPLNSFIIGDNSNEVRSMLMRRVDFLKMKQITGLFTSLTASGSPIEQTEVNISSLIDTWLILRSILSNGERNRGLSILKSRGMAHSNQMREFLLTDHGVQLRDVYVGSGDVLTGSARQTQEAQDLAMELMRKQNIERGQLGLERRHKALEAKIAALRAEFEVQETETLNIIGQEKSQVAQLTQDRGDMRLRRKMDPKPNKPKRGAK